MPARVGGVTRGSAGGAALVAWETVTPGLGNRHTSVSCLFLAGVGGYLCGIGSSEGGWPRLSVKSPPYTGQYTCKNAYRWAHRAS